MLDSAIFLLDFQQEVLDMSFDKKEYQKDYMRKKRMMERGEPPYDWVKLKEREFPSLDDFPSRGVVVQGHVLVSKGGDEHGVITEKDWLARLDYACKHGREGWSCKECLK